MKKLFFLLPILAFFAHRANSQTTELGFNEYGIAGDLYVPQFPDRFKNTLGFGAGAYASYQFTNKYSLLLRGNYRNLKHENLDLNSSKLFNDINLTTAIGLNLPELSNTRLLLGLQPSMVVSVSDQKLYSDLKNTLTLNAFGGIQIELNSYTKLEFSYTLPLRKTNYDRYIDAIPPVLSVGLITNFNTIGNRVNHWREMRRTLTMLKSDTLYFINRACEGELSDERLDELLATYFTFSEYKVLHQADIEKGLLPQNPVHFAVIGQYYAGKGEPLTTGVYLLDDKMQNVQFPYDMYIPIYNSTLNCMGNERNIIGGIIRFNRSLGR